MNSTQISAPTDPDLVDTRDMVVVHTAMLREFRLAPAAVRRLPPASSPASPAATVAASGWLMPTST